MVSDDMALVREYAQSNSEQAFATLVSRHIDLVYSVALCRVHDPHLAEEITQAVFVILARKAKTLSPSTILSGWLCRTARYASADAAKIQRRRQLREHEAFMESKLSEPATDVWNQIGPLLNEALNCLGKKEHDAIVLRFFERKELKQVAAVMGTTEDAARMRVTRGVEKLREFFTKSGVTLSAAVIAGAVSANAVQPAPPALAAAITAAALSATSFTTVAVIAAAKGIAMTTVQKTIITAAFAAIVGAGIYEARQAANARVEVQALQQQQTPLTDQIQQLQRERDETARQLTSLREDNGRLNRDGGELLRLRNLVGTLNRQNAPGTNTQPITPQAPAWKLHEPRWSNELQNVGLETPEAAAETVLWAAQHEPTQLTNMTRLPEGFLERYRQAPETAVEPLNDIARRVPGYTQVAGTTPHQIWLEGGDLTGGLLTITGLNGSVVTNRYNRLISFRVTFREDMNDASTERFQDMRLFKVNGQWKLIIPGISPNT